MFKKSWGEFFCGVLTCNFLIQMIQSPGGPGRGPFSLGLFTRGHSTWMEKYIYICLYSSNWNVPCPSIVNMRSNRNLAFLLIRNMGLLAVLVTVTNKIIASYILHSDCEDISKCCLTYHCFKITKITVIVRTDTKSGYLMLRILKHFDDSAEMYWFPLQFNEFHVRTRKQSSIDTDGQKVL